MHTQNFTLDASFDGLTLHLLVAEPQGQAKGVVQILHGMCEYKERYLPLIQHFTDNGFIVVCHDQRGHGDSVKDDKDRGYFYEKKAQAIVDDAVDVTQWIRTRYPHLPITLFGHSMGSMVARCYLQRHDTLINKVIISGSPVYNPLAPVAIGLAKTIGLFRGKYHRCKTLTYLSTGKGNNKFPGEEKGAWLSKNRANIQEFYAHPKGHFRFTCNGFENLFRLMKNTYTEKLYKVQNPDLPIYFVSGADDPVLGGAKNFAKTLAFMKKVGYEKVDGRLYENMRHELHNETDNQEVLADLTAQLQTV